MFIKKNGYIFLILFVFAFNIFPDKIYWDDGKLIETGKIGKIKTLSDDQNIFIVYSAVDNFSIKNPLFSLKILRASDGKNFYDAGISINNLFTSNEMGADFDVAIYNGKIYCIARTADKQIGIYEIDIDIGSIKTVFVLNKETEIVYLPKLAIDDLGRFLVTYFSYGKSEQLNYLLIGSGGKIINENVIGSTLISIFNPEIRFVSGVVYIVYQAKEGISGTGKIFNKIFLERSNDFGENWERRIISDITGSGQHNQRPDFVINNGTLYLLWEKDDDDYTSHIHYKGVDLLNFKDKFEMMVSSPKSEAHSPKILHINGLNHIFWYDNHSGSFQNYYIQGFEDKITEIIKMQAVKTRTMVLSPVIFRNRPLLIWNNTDNGTNRLFVQKDDDFVQSPVVYLKGGRKNGVLGTNAAEVFWNPVDDISGIKEYRVLLTQDKNEHIDKERVGISPFINSRKFNDIDDGVWFVKLAAYDNAGNESSTAILSFTVDTTPPLSPVFEEDLVGEDGAFETNSPLIRWKDKDDDGESFAGYDIVVRFFDGSYDMERAKDRARKAIDTGNLEKNYYYGKENTVEFKNMENGVVVVGVSGYDEAGNRSQFNFNSFILNKYIPVTVVQDVKLTRHGIVDKVLKISGKGFNVGGDVKRIFIDKDMKLPYDMVIEKNNFKILNDRMIEQINPIEIDDGRYFVGVEHINRGTTFYRKSIEYAAEWVFSHKNIDYFKFDRIRVIGKEINGTVIILAAIGMVWLLLFVVLTKGIVTTARERHYINSLLSEMGSVQDILNNREKIINKEVLMKIRLSLTVKYTLLILSLVIVIVTATSTMVGIFALRNSSANLTEEIKKRFVISLTNYQSGMKDIIFFNKETFDADDLTRNTASLPNIGFVFSNYGTQRNFTFGMGKSDDIRYNDLDLQYLKSRKTDERVKILEEKVYTDSLNGIIDSYKNRTLPLNIERDDFTTVIPAKIAALKENSLQQLKSSANREDSLKWDNVVKEIDRLSGIFVSLYRDNGKNYELFSQTEQSIMTSLYDFLINIGYIDTKVMIFPELNPDKLENSYIFYLPLFPNNISSPVRKYSGDVVICYSFKDTIELLDNQRRSLIIMVALITLSAIVISVFGSIILASSTIKPIKKMYRHVNVISTTEDYEKLLGTENEKLNIHSGDEIESLASSINDMTYKLIEKAKADKQLLLGKEIQKKFIPLDPHETDEIDIFGFYEGAKGVSGDYFDYKKIDDEHYAFIVCDVSGKAVPAALIMVQISTIFHSFTANFKPGVDKIETVNIVTEINDTVAERGFQGRFAAILVVILNIKTGKAHLTNAGYTKLLVYRKRLGKCEWVQLSEGSGAAGVFPSYMFPEPYKQESIKIEHGDIMFLFSDGIEESRNGKTIITAEGDEQPEEFGLERIVETINKAGTKKPVTIINELMAAEKRFRGELEQYDDLTLLAVMRK